MAFITVLTYSDYFYTGDMTEYDIRNWSQVNDNTLTYFSDMTPMITPDKCKVVVEQN